MPEHEQLNQLSPEEVEAERTRELFDVAALHLDLDDLDDLEKYYDTYEERLDYVYGRLLQNGEDPDMIFKDAGLTEEDDEVSGE